MAKIQVTTRDEQMRSEFLKAVKFPCCYGLCVTCVNTYQRFGETHFCHLQGVKWALMRPGSRDVSTGKFRSKQRNVPTQWLCGMMVAAPYRNLQDPAWPEVKADADIFVSRDVCGLRLLHPETWVHVRRESTDQNDSQVNKWLGETKNAYGVPVGKPW